MLHYPSNPWYGDLNTHFVLIAFCIEKTIWYLLVAVWWCVPNVWPKCHHIPLCFFWSISYRFDTSPASPTYFKKSMYLLLYQKFWWGCWCAAYISICHFRNETTGDRLVTYWWGIDGTTVNLKIDWSHFERINSWLWKVKFGSDFLIS